MGQVTVSRDLVRAANERKLAAGRKVFAELTRMCDDPMRHNTDLLMRILEANRETEYGRRYGFSDIRSVRDFQQRVPVTSYDDYVDYILRMTEDGEENLITSAPIRRYNKSSGTMGSPKRIPMSDLAQDQYVRYMANGPYGVLDACLAADDWKDGRIICLAESMAEERALPSAATYGAVSQKMTRRYRKNLPYLYTSPNEALFPERGTDTRYLHARFALMDADAGGFLAAFHSYLISLLRYIERNWELLVRDIRLGTIDESVELPATVRDRLTAALEPMEGRAQELHDIFSGGFDEPFVPRAWSHLRFVEGIGSGGFKQYADMIRARYTGDSIAMLKLGIVASEGVFSSPVGLGREDGALIPDTVFFEFLPLDAADDLSQVKTIAELEEGDEYELIVTNVSGLYRYRMRDAVRVVGRHRNTPPSSS